RDSAVSLTPGALGAPLILLALAVACAPVAPPAGGPRADTRDTAVWVYGAQRWTPEERDAQLARFATFARRLYLSVEDGPRLLVDDPDGARLGELLDRATGRFGLAVEAMLLQDPGWTGDPAGATERVRRVVTYHAARRARGQAGFAGLHFDIEPHSEEVWACATAPERAATLSQLHEVFRRARAAVQQGAPAPAPQLTAALPWWLGHLSVEVPNAAPAAWLAELDEVVLMVYGDPGGPLVGESVPAVVRRIDDTRLWRDLPPGRGLRIGLATFEHKDLAALRATIAGVESAFGQRAGFRGTAIFANDQVWDAPLVPFVEGRVVDVAGRAVAGARLRGAGHDVESNRCGGFGFKGLPVEGVELEVTAQGYLPIRVPVGRLVPGRVRELPPVRLERAP
ncbi:MAG TPA: carboxypeptidase-like regulatory domain-containing protein, partial [Methylomirabilota bacterium]